jgi:uncharacterized protein (DUF58 family)
MVQPRVTNDLRGRVRRWALRRQGTDSLPLRLAARRLYIVPTRAGWMFAALVAVMFVAGMNYGNGLALLLTFWLAGFLLVAMVQTQRTLAGVQLLAAAVAPAFAGEAVTFQLTVATRGAAADLALATDDAVSRAAFTASQCRDDTLDLQITVRRRGPWQVPLLRLGSRAPFGLFQTWTWLALPVSTIVYPRLAGGLPIPDTPGDETGATHMVTGQEELAWLRDFREGDSPRQVAWKAYARGAPLLVREYRSHATASRDFDFDSLRDADVETRLSQLTRWVVDAAANSERWTLRLPNQPPLTGSGTDHRERCLQQLALYGLRAAPAP